jgi:hypothetical protein
VILGEHLNLIAIDTTDVSRILDAVEYFRKEYDLAKPEMNLVGQRLEDVMYKLPGLMGYRYSQYQEIESILELMEIREAKIQNSRLRYYLKGYGEALSERIAMKFAEQDDEVITYRELKQQIVFLRNLFAGLTKAFDSIGYQLNNLRALKVAGLSNDMEFRP